MKVRMCHDVPCDRYTFHLVRVGEAIEVSLTGEVANGTERISFAERRRWEYQKQTLG